MVEGFFATAEGTQGLGGVGVSCDLLGFTYCRAVREQNFGVVEGEDGFVEAEIDIRKVEEGDLFDEGVVLLVRGVAAAISSCSCCCW